jgi:hypothetical protein
MSYYAPRIPFELHTLKELPPLRTRNSKSEIYPFGGLAAFPEKNNSFEVPFLLKDEFQRAYARGVFNATKLLVAVPEEAAEEALYQILSKKDLQRLQRIFFSRLSNAVSTTNRRYEKRSPEERRHFILRKMYRASRVFDASQDPICYSIFVIRDL